jgi:hypothetical protein
MGSKWQGDPNSPYVAMEQAHKRILLDYLDKEVDRLTDLAIKELIIQRLNEIDYNVTVNGEKITDAIITQFTRGLTRT